MKIRLGFVSNSSTTSFCLYGAVIDIDEAYAKLCEVCKLKFSQEVLDEFNALGEGEQLEDWTYYFGEIIKLEIRRLYDNVYIGVSPRNFNDDLLFLENKNIVQQRLQELFGKDVKCEWYLIIK